MQINEHLNTDDVAMIWLQAARQVDTLNRMLNAMGIKYASALKENAELKARLAELDGKEVRDV
jgi:hypothetical protein